MTTQIPPAQPLPPRDRSLFLAHFEAMSCSTMQTNFDILPPMLRGLPSVPQQVADSLHVPPSPEEVKAALQSMKRGTAPGPDGFPVEFYLTFWNEIGAAFTAVIRRCFEDGVFPSSFRDGRIVLIPKGDASPLSPEDWRPITLLNVDYKIFATVIVRRLRALLNTLVGHHQASSVPGREIHSLSFTTRDVIAYTLSRSARGLLVSLDQEKAFDRLEHAYIFNVLTAFGFPRSFVELIRNTYAGIKSTLVLDGWESAAFPITRGVRQGCPLSPVLFVLSIEPFLCALEADSRVRGLALPGSSVVNVTAFADDITL